jgi:hypothetical protein
MSVHRVSFSNLDAEKLSFAKAFREAQLMRQAVLGKTVSAAGTLGEFT